MNDFNDINYDELVGIVIREIDAEKIILFGSRGCGDNKPDAVVIVENKDKINNYLKMGKAYA